MLIVSYLSMLQATAVSVPLFASLNHRNVADADG